MKCVILGRYIRNLGKAIQALAKVGEEIYIEPQSDSLSFKTVNSSRSAVMTFKFYEDFFAEYVEKSKEDLERIDPESTSQNPSKCRLMMRSILMVFKSMNVLEKTVESCTIQVLPQESKVKIQLICKYYVTKLYTFPFIESERLDMYHQMPSEGNSFTCQAKVLNEAALNFLKNQEEVTMTAFADKFVMKNYLSSDPRENQTAVHTELTMLPYEFEAFQVNNDCSITYCLKELRSIIAFADAFTLPLTAVYGAPNEPIFFSVTHSDVFEGALIMATMASEDPESRNTSMNTSQGNSSFGGTEDLLGRNPKFIREKRKSQQSENQSIRAFLNNSSVRKVSATQTSAASNGDISRYESTQVPRTSTCDLEQGPVPNFSEGLDDVLEDTRVLPLSETPPSKRARFFFKKCFEKTIDLRSLPGSDNVLAPDSDEEN